MSACTQVEVNAYPVQVEVTASPVTVEVLRDSNLTFIQDVDFNALPIYPNNQAALNGGLVFGEAYRTVDGFVKVVINYVGFSNLALDFSTGYSYLVRAF
jgi:hypothetical protein